MGRAANGIEKWVCNNSQGACLRSWMLLPVPGAETPHVYYKSNAGEF